MTGKRGRRVSVPWWQQMDLPPFPPAPWDMARVDDHLGQTSYLITSEAREPGEPAVAIVPLSAEGETAEIEAQQRATAYLITAAPALFMGAAALVRGLEDSQTRDPGLLMPLQFLRHALDLARGRG